MARITVEDCLKKIDSQYDLVLLAKERTTQLNAGSPALVPQDNDKNTVISLREIGDGKVSIKTIEDSAINRLRKNQVQSTEAEDIESDHEDDFDKIYKGEISKSGAPILPSKRVRRMPEKIVSSAEEEEKEDDKVDIDSQEIVEEESGDPKSSEGQTE